MHISNREEAKLKSSKAFTDKGSLESREEKQGGERCTIYFVPYFSHP